MAEMTQGRLGDAHADVLSNGRGVFQALIQNSPDVLFRAELVPHFHHTYVSPSVMALVGVTPDEIYADPALFFRTIHPDDLASLQELMATGLMPQRSIVLRFIRKDGAVVWTEQRCTVVRDSDGQPIAIEGIVRDVTEQKLTEEALRGSQQILRDVLNHFPGAVCWKDANSVYLGCNQACAQGAGLDSPAQIVGKTDRDLPWARTEAEAYRADDREVIESGIPKLRIAETQLRADGSIIWLETSKIPLLDGTGKVIGVLVVSSDITDRRRAEEASRLAREAAEVANRAKDLFLARLSHDLRTPMTPVLVIAQMLEDDPTLPAQHRQAISLIRRNIELETRLIDDLLDLTRIAQGKLELHCETVDLNAQVHSAVAMCSGDIAEKQITLNVEQTAQQRHVHADAARVQQIVWNLLKNAVKFTPSGGCITLRTFNEREDMVSVTVKDSGVGIEPSALSRIFDAFEQGGRDITRQYGGMGLGLAISKSLVEMHRGSIRASSAGLGLGSQFTVEFPCVPAPDMQRSTPHDSTVPNLSLRGMRILLVEDHVDTATVMSALLRRHHCEVHVTHSVADARRAAGQCEFDLLISDIGLPDGSGADLMRELRQGRPITGIALSGYGMDHDLQRSYEAGFCAHLTKPVSITKLREAIRLATAGRGTSA